MITETDKLNQARKRRLANRMRNADSLKEKTRLAIILFRNCYQDLERNSDGGPGSGNWGHESVKGKRGGVKARRWFPQPLCR